VGEGYVQVGLRGYWPGDDVFAWQREHGIVDIRMHELRRRGIDDVVDKIVGILGSAPAGGPRTTLESARAVRVG
jgi:hypothetical protein